jgi:hypothetical protein
MLIFDPEDRDDTFFPKHLFTYGPHGAISQNMATCMATAMRTSNPTIGKRL